MTHDDLLALVVHRVRAATPPDRPCLVAVDGADGAGKSRLATALTRSLVAAGLDARHASVDGFHRPRRERHARGRRSSEGPRGVLVMDGIFLLRDELVEVWDLSVRLEASPQERFRRMARRDGSPADLSHPDNRRYLLGQVRYEQACDPRGRADLVVGYDDWDDPQVLHPPA